jgi:hypothetical protein
MKTLISKIALFIAVLLSFFSCEDDTVDYGLGEYYQNLATVLNDSAYILDSGESLYNVNYEQNKPLDANKRVFLTYSYAEKENSLYDHAIVVHGISEIAQSELKAVDKARIDSFPAEPVFLESVWIGSHYLNMQFYFNYHSKSHSIGLMTDSLQLHADTIQLYFKHDTNLDSPGYPAHLFLSFDLEQVLGKPVENKKPLAVHINTDNYADDTYKFNY